MNQQQRSGRLKNLTLCFMFLSFIPLIHIGCWSCGAASTRGIIIDHTCTNISRIPEQWINKAKAEFKISYGHTSHGSQLISGMRGMRGEIGSLYWFDKDGAQGGLSFHDYEPSGDLGNPDRTSWASKTRSLLDQPGNDRNLIMWSWCGQVSSATEEDIKTYLNLMSKLEEDYPEVTFVYMTGHLDGSGKKGKLNTRNEQIRDFCRANNKVLFDFADIESYDPDGNCFLDKNANDNCDYKDGSVTRNWAKEWCDAHPGECSECTCAHSQSLNCDLKGRAFWWMMARLAGWNPDSAATSDPSNPSNSGTGGTPQVSCNGDLNRDSEITPKDALIAFQCYLGLGPCSYCTDVNFDSMVTPADALCLFKTYLGAISCLAGSGVAEAANSDPFPDPIPTPWNIDLYGNVNANEGSWVLAYSTDGILCGKAIVKENGNYGVLHIYLDDPGTKEKDGMQLGEPIIFEVDGVKAIPFGPDEAMCQGNTDDLMQINLKVE
ncbi:MAG: hypothetical protein AB1847_08285 [bacterium]